MATDIIIIPDLNTNESITIADSSDYTTLGISISDVNAVRFLFATYNSVLNASTVSALVANYEYTVVSGTLTIGNRYWIEGQTFIAYKAAVLPTSGVVIKETGYYCSPNLTVPSVQITSIYTPSQIGEDNTYFQDNFRYVKYEIYDTKYTSSPIPDESKFIVQGTQGDYLETEQGQIIYVGETYYSFEGENMSFTAYGNAYPVKYFDGTTFAFWTDYNATQVMKSYNVALSNSTYNLSEDFRANYQKCVTCLSLPYIYSNTGSTYSEVEIQNSLDYINTVLELTDKQIRNA